MVLPNGCRSSDGTPTGITFTGWLFGETFVLAVAEAYRKAAGLNRRHPPFEGFLQARLKEEQEKKQ